MFMLLLKTKGYFKLPGNAVILEAKEEAMRVEH